MGGIDIFSCNVYKIDSDYRYALAYLDRQNSDYYEIWDRNFEIVTFILVDVQTSYITISSIMANAVYERAE